MSNMNHERVLSVHHWNDTLFSFKCTRDPGLRFENGQFVMIGLQQPNGRPLMRAYSIASPNWEEHLEFFSIKVPDGPLTSQLQHLKEGDEIIISKKPTGTLVLDDLKPGKHLYLLSTGTGLAPFMSVIQDPETYERFEKVILCHGVRYVNEVAMGIALALQHFFHIDHGVVIAPGARQLHGGGPLGLKVVRSVPGPDQCRIQGGLVGAQVLGNAECPLGNARILGVDGLGHVVVQGDIETIALASQFRTQQAEDGVFAE